MRGSRKDAMTDKQASREISWAVKMWIPAFYGGYASLSRGYQVRSLTVINTQRRLIGQGVVNIRMKVQGSMELLPPTASKTDVTPI